MKILRIIGLGLLWPVGVVAAVIALACLLVILVISAAIFVVRGAIGWNGPGYMTLLLAALFLAGCSTLDPRDPAILHLPPPTSLPTP